METLQILINYYKEPVETIDRLLLSIVEQEDVKLSVRIGGDGGNSIPPHLFDKYPYDIAFTMYPHRGVCPTRNALLRDASAEYVMFCDADDHFIRRDGLKTALRMAKEKKADVITSRFMAEKIVGNTHIIKNAYSEWLMHGKLFKREYLNRESIRFLNWAAPGEMYFLGQALKLTKKIERVEEPFYLWTHNPKSITRGDPLFFEKTYPALVNCYTELTENYKMRGRKDLLRDIIPAVIYMCYFDISEWKGTVQDLQNAASESIAQYVTTYRDEYFQTPRKKREKKYRETMLARHATGITLGSIDCWIEGMTQK